MEPWRSWLEMAHESQTAARLAEREKCWRSCADRYYYAAYQAITAVLLYRKLTPPAAREAWNHEETPRMLKEHFQPLISSRDKRNDLADRLGKLYKLRIIADYIGSQNLKDRDIQTARRDVGYLIKVAEEILPKE